MVQCSSLTASRDSDTPSPRLIAKVLISAHCATARRDAAHFASAIEAANQRQPVRRPRCRFEPEQEGVVP